MNLTHDYRTVRAVFEESRNIPELQLQQPKNPQAGVYSKVQAGPFVYTVLIGPTRNPGTVAVTFKLQDIIGTPKELAQEFSRIYKRNIWPREAKKIRQRLLQDPTGKTGTGRSSEVLGHVISAVNEYINKYYPQCLQFDALEPSRKDLYRSMIKRFLPDWTLQEAGTVFTVCRKKR